MTLNVCTAEWNEKSARWLAVGCTEFFTLDNIRQSVIDKRASLFELRKDDQHIGSFTVCIEERNGFKEMVITAAGGHAPGENAYKIMTAYLQGLAKEQGIKYLRGHTHIAGVGRMMEAAGFELSEFTYRKEVK